MNHRVIRRDFCEYSVHWTNVCDTYSCCGSSDYILLLHREYSPGSETDLELTIVHPERGPLPGKRCKGSIMEDEIG